MGSVRLGQGVQLLGEAGISLTLVDLGASLEPFRPFVPLLRHATYVGFDPDSRETHSKSDGSGRSVMVPRAVITDPQQEKVQFYLTHNPTCSSTLPPRMEAVGNYFHSYRYEVVATAEVAATTIDQALASLDLHRVDWIKLDTQGTDTRLLRSLGAHLWDGLMAVDAEPGFNQHYEGEDTFGSLHEEMVGRGFWMSDITFIDAVRLRRSTFDEHLGGRSKLSRMGYEFTLKRSPTAAGPRYLRTLDALEAGDPSVEDYLRLWACAFFSGNHPYALDVIASCEKAHGSNPTTASIHRLTVRRNRLHAMKQSWRLVQKMSLRNIRRFVTKPY